MATGVMKRLREMSDVAAGSVGGDLWWLGNELAVLASLLLVGWLPLWGFRRNCWQVQIGRKGCYVSENFRRRKAAEVWALDPGDV
jgi:hypothetical protein